MDGRGSSSVSSFTRRFVRLQCACHYASFIDTITRAASINDDSLRTVYSKPRLPTQEAHPTQFKLFIKQKTRNRNAINSNYFFALGIWKKNNREMI